MFTLSQQTIKKLAAYALKENAGYANVIRLGMYRALLDALSEHAAPTKRLLSISKSHKLTGILGLKACQYTEANYPECNILNLPFENGSFDFCVSDQVFEHIEGSPFKAFGESVRVVKPGAYICHTTCFINPVHGSPKDFWRFTPDALRLLAQESGAEVVLADGWGNKEVWGLVDTGQRFQRIPDDPDHPLHAITTLNDPKWPICTWVIARKPS